MINKINNNNNIFRFESVQTAVKARNELDEANIYENCCTLKVRFSRVSKSYF
jgi:hypothetical protein